MLFVVLLGTAGEIQVNSQYTQSHQNKLIDKTRQMNSFTLTIWISILILKNITDMSAELINEEN